MPDLEELRRRLQTTTDPHEFYRIERALERGVDSTRSSSDARPKRRAIESGSLDEFVQSSAMFVEPTDERVCPNCDAEMRLYTYESTLVCSVCGCTISYFDYHIQNATYDQELNLDTSNPFSYKRVSHFNEFLAQFQGKEASRIPEKVLENLHAELQKERLDVSKVTKTKLRELLRKLDMSKYYDNIPQILRELTGDQNALPEIPEMVEARLRDMFVAIQEPFSRHCPSDRVNFLSYSYVLYKFCELIGEYDLMEQFTLLKNRERLYEHDKIWKLICNDLGWDFYRTI